MAVTDVLMGAWRKSSHSGAGNDCVELADLGQGRSVRDSKNPAGPRLTFAVGPWVEFLERTKTY